MSRSTTSPAQFVVPSTVVQSPGQGPVFELGPRAGKSALLLLRITEIIEQESLDVSVWGSADGKEWGEQPLFTFPQKFYQGLTPAALHLARRTDVKYLQARWEVNRFGRGVARPRFQFELEVQDLR